MKYSSEFSVISKAKTSPNNPPGDSVNNVQIALDYDNRPVVVMRGTFTPKELSILSYMVDPVERAVSLLDALTKENLTEQAYAIINAGFDIYAIDGKVIPIKI